MGLEYFRAFPWIDYVVVGEGEEVFPALVKNVLRGQEDALPAGVASRKDGELQFQPNTALFSDFSEVGPPDYDDYFDMVRELEGQGSTGLNRILLYEGRAGAGGAKNIIARFAG